MIVRRLVLSLVLIMFAAVSVGVIVGLDASARSQLAGRVLPSPSPTPEASVPRSTPEFTPRTTATPTPKLSPTPTPTPAAKSKAKPKPTAKPKPPAPAAKPKANPTPKSTPRPTTGSGSSTTKQRAKATGRRYLKGPLTKGRGGTVYLTFDDGPGPFTAQVLQILDRTGSTATFFHLGVNEPGYPHLDARIRAQGSKVGNHSFDHPDLTTLSTKQLRRQIRDGPQARCFRPPYGAANAAVRKAIAAAGMREVRWDVDTFDWAKPGVATLAKSGRLKAIRDGSVVLLHDGGGDRTQTVAALPTIIADLQARGFKVRALPYC